MNTPGVSSNLSQTIPPFTRNVNSTSILQGTYNLSNIYSMPDIRQFLQAMAKPPVLDSTPLVDTIIITQDYQKGFKKLSNKISLSPSNQHISHYKLLAKDPGLLEILARTITLPFKHGFSPLRWRTAVQFMLEKNQGTPKFPNCE